MIYQHEWKGAVNTNPSGDNWWWYQFNRYHRLTEWLHDLGIYDAVMTLEAARNAAKEFTQ